VVRGGVLNKSPKLTAAPQSSLPRSTRIVRGRQLGSVVFFRRSDSTMPEPDPFPKVRRHIVRLLRNGLSRFGFTQFGSTAYFTRDRGPVRDAMFFQKMRSNAITVAYGVSIVPDRDEWSPGLMHACWLADQRFYIVKYESQVDQSICKMLADFEQQAIPWFGRFVTESDVMDSA
jgi:hypothetical protein